MGYLTKEILNGFSKYKYSSRDTSPLSVYIMHPFWNYLVEFFPRSVAPNTMTFLGFLLTALNVVLLSYYDWNFYAQTNLEGTEAVPRFVWLLASINIFLAYTLDGVDGKQARRIKLSGPLGELFDHGLDSYSASLIPICIYSVFGRGDKFSVEPLRFYFVLLMILISFHLSHFEKYNTGVLFLPWGYDFAMWGSTLMFLVNYIWGGDVWKLPLFGSEYTCGHFMESVLHIGALINVPPIFYNIYRSYVDKTGKMRSFSEAVRPLIPLATFVGICLMWAYYSPSNIIYNDPRAMYLLTGTIFSNITCRLIVSQMSSTRCEIFNHMIPFLVVSFIASMLVPRIERIVLYVLLAYSILAHCHYGKHVVLELCDHFDRICFSVNLKTKKEDK